MTHVFLPLVLLQIADDLGNEKFCIDASQSGAGNWLKYIRVACSCDEQNLAVCHINDQVMTSAISQINCCVHPCGLCGGSTRVIFQALAPLAVGKVV